MTEEAAQQEQEDNAQAVHDGHVRRFEKVWRLLDSPEKGEAEAAFRNARNLIGKIGLTFADLLEMAGNSSNVNEDELRAIIEEYRVANEQLKSVEEIIVAESERLNFLLRHFRDADVQAKELDPKPFKKDLVDVIDRVEKISADFAKIAVPENAEDLERLYLSRMAEALLPHKGHITKGLFDKLVVWSIKKAGRDISSEGILKLQDMVLAQERIIHEQAVMIDEMKAVRTLSQDIYEKLGLIVSASAPRSEFDEAMRLLRDAQLMLGDGQDIKTLQTHNQALEQELQERAKKTTQLEEQVQQLTAALTAAQQREPEVVYIDKNGAEVGRRKSYDAPKAAAPASAAQSAIPTADSADFKALKNQTAQQEEIIRDLHQRLANSQVHALLGSNEARFIANLQNNVLPRLPELQAQLQEAIDVMRRPPEPPKNLKERIYATVAASFGRSAARKQRKAMATVKEIQDTIQLIHGADYLFSSLIPALDARAQQYRDEATNRIDAYFNSAAENYRGEYESAQKSFRKVMADNDVHAEQSYAVAAKARQDALHTMDGEIEKRAAELLRLRDMESDMQRQFDSVQKENADVKINDTQSSVSIGQRDVASKMLYSLYNKGDTKGMELALIKGADINTRFAGGQTILLHAIYAQNLPMIEFLLSKGADVCARDNEGRDVITGLTKVNWRNGSNQNRVWELVLSRMADMRADKIISKYDPSEAEQLQRGAANEAMFVAINRSDIDALRLAMQKGADINAFKNGQTVLMVTVFNSQYDILPVVLEYKPNILIQDKDGKNIFDMIMARGWRNHADRQRAFDSCLSPLPDIQPAKTNIVDPQAQVVALNSLLQNAFNSNHKEVMASAIAKGADINTPVDLLLSDKTVVKNATLLMSCVVNENADVSKFLMEQGADIYQADANGKTVFDYLKKSWSSSAAKQKIMEALLETVGNSLTRPQEKVPQVLASAGPQLTP